MKPEIIAFAIEAHQKVNHLYDGKPYSVHLAMVVINAYKYIDYVANDTDVISACWLHDTIEDCRLTYNDIQKVAGQRVADIVYAVTNEKGRNRKERANHKYYEDMRKVAWARYVKLCDRLANVQYSKSTNSDMFRKYQEEHSTFMNYMFPDPTETFMYQDLIDEMQLLLTKPPLWK